MIRILKDTPGSIAKPFYQDGVLVDPGVVTATVTRADGTVVVSGAATTGSGAAERTLNLTAVQNGLLDTYTVAWASPTQGTLPSTVEIVGGFVFTIAEARAFGITDTFSTADVIAMRTTVEEEIEKACSRAFVPRYARHAVDGSGDCEVRLRRKVRSIRAVDLDGSSVDVSMIVPTVIGAYYPAGWRWGVGNYVIGYEHGFSEAPEGVKRAALLLAKTWFEGQRSPVDDRAITFDTTEGGSYSLAVPGRNGSLFGIPDVDSVLDRYRSRVSVA